MTNTAWVFPGQGSQAIGMGADLFELPVAQPKLKQAEDILGWSVQAICQSEDDKVSHTFYTQPCLYVLESILVDLMGDRGHQPDLVAGHSLGEYVALYATEVFDYETGLRLVQKRATLMENASTGGMMAAVIGFDRSQLDEQIAQLAGVVLANDNNPSQAVVSGTVEGVEQLLSQIKAKRIVRLNVSGAFHSPLMAEASTQFQADLEAVPFRDARVPVLSNVDPTPATQADELKDRLIRQMTGPVRWREISLRLAEEGVEQVMEIGPGTVLTGLIKRTAPGVKLMNVREVAEIPG